MKKKLVILVTFIAGSFSVAVAQQEGHEQTDKIDTTTQRLPDTANNQTFRDDTTDATVSNSNLSGSSGTAAASGAGGQGAVSHPGHNTSSDIYNIERRDSIERAKEDSIRSATRRRTRTGK